MAREASEKGEEEEEEEANPRRDTARGRKSKGVAKARLDGSSHVHINRTWWFSVRMTLPAASSQLSPSLPGVTFFGFKKKKREEKKTGKKRREGKKRKVVNE